MDGSIKREAYYDRNLDIEAYGFLEFFKVFRRIFIIIMLLVLLKTAKGKCLLKIKSITLKKAI